MPDVQRGNGILRRGRIVATFPWAIFSETHQNLFLPVLRESLPFSGTFQDFLLCILLVFQTLIFQVLPENFQRTSRDFSL